MADSSDENGSFQKELDTILIKVASRCNINCTYCYVYNMGDDNWTRQEKLISDSTLKSILSSLQELAINQERLFSVVLHGGEPLLLGPKKIKKLLSGLRDILTNDFPISLQTNGILITQEILDICSLYHVSIAVSIDGPSKVHNKHRITHNGKDTFEDVLNGIHLLKTHPDSKFLNAGLLAVVDPTSDPIEVYSFFKELAAPSVDFLYKDGNHSRLPLDKSTIDSVEYGEWTLKVLITYLEDTAPLPIRMLDDMLKVILGGSVTKEGLGLTDFGIVIIDTDGTITKNDTLKSSFNGADQFENPVNIKDVSLLEFAASTDFVEYRKMQKPTCSSCLNCPELNICGGGMILHRWQNENGFDNPSVYCSDQLHLIKKMRGIISQIDIDNER